ncbi:MAG: hypothetical protein HY785_23615 [Oscillatoriophycideae cyanobacterium NC_groundwater_1537_Pr4_S-0.65um_50_18]|nr:hypothetical protein [Oscillatoriophycideae cyanobacterium NC_groundwater_1537_Pr4_S-0.65um_50_18]
MWFFASSGLKVDLERLSQLSASRITTERFSRKSAEDISVRANQIALRNGSQITADTAAEGQGGNLQITASTIDLVSGLGPLSFSSLSARGNSADATG